jgi:hypothetical protein
MGHSNSKKEFRQHTRELVGGRGSIRYINREDDLEAAILYVRDGQDTNRY